MKKADAVQWLTILQTENISEEILRQFKEQIGYIAILQKKQLSKDFIRELFSKCNDLDIKEHIQIYQKLDQKFIKEITK